MNRHEQRKQKRLMNPGIAEGYQEMAVDMREEDGRIIIEPIRQPEFDLESLVARITSQNLYEEVDFGVPVGKEVW